MNPIRTEPRMRLALLVAALAFASLAPIANHLAAAFQTLPQLALLAGFGLAAVYGLRDASLIQTRALPNGAATVYSTGLDLQGGLSSDKRGLQVVINAPAVTTAQCPDTKTLKYSLQHASASDYSDAADLHTDAITQTGAGGAGAAAAEKRIGLPDNCKRYIRLKVVGSAAGDATGASATLQVMPDLSC